MEFLLDHAVDEKFVDDGKKQVLINGEDTDTITLSDLLKDGSDIGDWKQITGVITAGGEKYDVYQHSGTELELLVQQGVKVELDNH